MTKEEKQADISTFEKEIAKLPQDLQSKLKEKEQLILPLIKAVEEKTKDKSMGFYLVPLIEMKNNVPTPNFDKLEIHFLLDDFEKPITYFDAKILLQDKFDEILVEEKKKDNYGQEYVDYYLKDNKDIMFFGTSISILRENCFDGIYDDLKKLGSSFVHTDNRGFISALKSIDIHRNMLLQKFEKYIVVYAGAGSWLRGEKSNDFDVFVVVDDTDVKRMPRMQVKDQLTRIIWQMAREVAQLTGINVHTQVYLLTDFWDALKDAHPVMFTFLRDGVPFYDRGLYSAWKELLKLGKIKPSAEAIDMHMNVGNQLIDRAKKTLTDIMMNDIYYAVLNPAQALLMLKGYNPTTPKETVKIFKEVLLAKDKIITQKEVKTLEEAVAMFKKIEHDKTVEVKGVDIDKALVNAEDFLQKIKKMFEEVTEERTKDSVVTAYSELLTQMRTLPGYKELDETKLLKKFSAEFVETKKLPSFVKVALDSINKAKKDYDSGKITVTEVNKILKEIRNVLTEIKEYREKNALSEVNRKKLIITYNKDKTAELLCMDSKTYLNDLSSNKLYELEKDEFKESKTPKEELTDSDKIQNLELTSKLLDSAKKTLGAKDLFL